MSNTFVGVAPIAASAFEARRHRMQRMTERLALQLPLTLPGEKPDQWLRDAVVELVLAKRQRPYREALSALREHLASQPMTAEEFYGRSPRAG